MGTYKCHLLVCERRRSPGSTWKWWGHFNTTFCNQTCLSFLHSGVVGTQSLVLCFLCPLGPLHHVVNYIGNTKYESMNILRNLISGALPWHKHSKTYYLVRSQRKKPCQLNKYLFLQEVEGERWITKHGFWNTLFLHLYPHLDLSIFLLKLITPNIKIFVQQKLNSDATSLMT